MAKKSASAPADAPTSAPVATPAAATAAAPSIPPTAAPAPVGVPAPPRPTRPRPEHKIGPFAGGIGVAIWLNTVDSEEGTKSFRSITIAPRRYQDRNTGEWRDAGSYHPSDLPALIFALQKAQEYVFTQPLPPADSAASGDADDSLPF